jgi:hypothetical protein
MDNALSEAHEHMKEFVHNGLGYDSSQVRVLERRGSSGDPYSAVMVNEGDEENPEWVKDLQSTTGSETGYLRHGETDIDGSRERGLEDIWDQSEGVSSATEFFRNLDRVQAYGTREESDEEAWNGAMREYSLRNDHIVVGDNEDEGEVCYTRDGAEALVEIQDFDANDTFNKEMELVENVTKFYHNELDSDMFVQIDVTGDSLGDNQEYLTELDSGQTLYAEEVDVNEYDEAVLSLYEQE